MMSGRKTILENAGRPVVIGMIAVMAAAVGLVWWFIRSPVRAACPDCDVVVVSLDDCGAVHLPCYGYSRDTSPNLCELGRQSVFFANSYSDGAYTLPSHASMFTGLYPTHHRIVSADSETSMSASIPFLPEVLQKRGYETILYMATDDRYLPTDRIYNRGITRIVPQKDGTPDYFREALAKLQSNRNDGKKTFLFLHTYRCHRPWVFDGEPLRYTKDPHPEIPILWDDIRGFTEDFYRYLLGIITKDVTRDGPTMTDLYRRLVAAKGYKEAQQIYRQTVATSPDLLSVLSGYYEEYNYVLRLDPANDSQVAYVKALYDQKINDLDATYIKDLLAAVKDGPLKNRTVLIVTADHGEEFGERGIFGHLNLVDTNLRVPLIIRIPGIAPRIVADQVQGVDLMPTILDAVGIAGRDYTFDGISLLPLMTGKMKLSDRLIIAQRPWPTAVDSVAIRRGKWKLTASEATDSARIIPVSLYDTKSDPQEKRDILWDHLDIARMLVNTYRKVMHVPAHLPDQ
jgi:arylsulfatase A-like enzyme